MAALRVLIHSLGFVILAQAIEFLASRTGNPGLVAIAGFMRWGSDIPFAIAASSALHQHKTVLVGLLGLTVLLGAPGNIQELAVQVSPIGTGVLIGSMVRKIIEPESTNGTSPSA